MLFQQLHQVIEHQLSSSELEAQLIYLVCVVIILNFTHELSAMHHPLTSYTLLHINRHSNNSVHLTLSIFPSCRLNDLSEFRLMYALDDHMTEAVIK
jgi:hypothetical protein